MRQCESSGGSGGLEGRLKNSNREVRESRELACRDRKWIAVRLESLQSDSSTCGHCPEVAWFLHFHHEHDPIQSILDHRAWP